MGSNSKRVMISPDTVNNETDLISRLPDELISHILSFVRVKCAMRTCVLSKRWKYVWTHITNLDFESKYSAAFVFFVDQVLRHCKMSHIPKFRLHCESDHTHPIRKHAALWVCDAIRRNVCELDIGVHSLELPLSLFSCKTLSTLKLVATYVDVQCVPLSFSLPCLKTLHFECDNPPASLTHKLFRSCPVLEDLVIKGDVSDAHDIIFHVSAPALKRLDVGLRMIDFEEMEIEFIINAPSLVYLNLDEEFLANYVVKDLSSLADARVNIGNCCISGYTTQEYATRAIELLAGATTVKSLSLYGRTMGALDFACDNNMPMFRHLTYMEVEIHDCCSWRVLANLLESAPHLEALSLDKVWDHDYDADDILDWSEPQSPPNCLLYYLEELEIKGFRGDDSQIKVVKYLMGNARVLKELTISSQELSSESKVQFHKKLVKFPMVSKTCEVICFGDFLKS